MSLLGVHVSCQRFPSVLNLHYFYINSILLYVVLYYCFHYYHHYIFVIINYFSVFLFVKLYALVCCMLTEGFFCNESINSPLNKSAASGVGVRQWAWWFPRHKAIESNLSCLQQWQGTYSFPLLPASSIRGDTTPITAAVGVGVMQRE